MSTELSPQALRELADRLESEAATAAEQREAERLQAALDAGQDSLADKIAERMLERMGDRLEKMFDERFIVDESGEQEDDEQHGDENDDDQQGDGGEQEEEVDVEGRWKPTKVFGAKIYSGPPEPDTVHYRDENGKVQTRPGRRPGTPYQVEWEQLADEPAEGEEEAA